MIINYISTAILIFVTYLLIKLLHVYRIKAVVEKCTVCKSKRTKRIKRSKLIKYLPFASRKEYCRDCRSKYTIIAFFSKRYIIINRKSESIIVKV